MPELSPNHPAADRNLLFGILALQMDFITRDALIAAMNAWVIDKAKPLGEILVVMTALSAAHRAMLEPLVDEHVNKHGNDPQRSLAAISSVESVRETLNQIADPDVQASLRQVSAPQEADDPYATRAESKAGRPAGARFRVLRPHRKGGLGEVFVAHDEELGREVALKEIQGHYADDRGSRARFVREAEITGRLEHPGVVPVYGLGSYADGRPFYAMRFIEGDNLQDAIDRFHKADKPDRNSTERRLAFRELLGRFVDVCQAVAYAHSRGVLHRDLKPGNIMLGQYGETLVVDWGLAKGVGQSDGVPAMVSRPIAIGEVTPTQMGEAVGTPAYMSPEQAAGRLDELGPASDVYGLGATLYALLVGRAPFKEPDIGALIQKVVRGDFAPPRQVKVKAPAALDAICRKAMALKPEDRYASPQALAADIEHWLADEAVTAYAEPMMQRAARWARRHRTMVTGAAALGVTALVALVIGLIGIEHERQQTAKERDKKDKALQVEMQARAMAMDALRKLAHTVVEEQMARRTILTDDDRQFLRDIQRQYEEFAVLPGEDVEQRAIRAEGHLRVGSMRHRLGEQMDAEASCDQSRLLYNQLVADFPADPRFRRALGMTHGKLGQIFLDTGRLKDAEVSLTEALAIRTKLAAEFPTNPEYQNEHASSQRALGSVFQDAGRLKDAEKAFSSALAIQRQLAVDFPTNTEFREQLSASYDDLGVLLRHMGRLQDAEAAFTDALIIQKQVVTDFPTRPNFRRALAVSYHNLGVVFHTMRRLKDAEMAYTEALAIQKQLAADFPTRPNFRRELAVYHNTLGSLFSDSGRFREGEVAFTNALPIHRQLAADFPTNPEFRRDLARCHTNLGIAFHHAGRPKDAETAYNEALAIQKQLAAEFPKFLEAQYDLAEIYNALGLVFYNTGRNSNAEMSFKDAVVIQKQLADAFPNMPAYRNLLAGALVNLANLSVDRGDFDQARRHLEEAQLHHQAVLRGDPTNLVYREYYQNNIRAMIKCCAGVGDNAAALKAATTRRNTGWDPPTDAYDAARALAQCVPMVEKDKSATETDRSKQIQFYADHAISMFRDAVAIGYKDVAQMKQDRELDPLRQREDFKRLLAELEEKYPQPPAKSDDEKPDDARIDRLRLGVWLITGWPVMR